MRQKPLADFLALGFYWRAVAVEAAAVEATANFRERNFTPL
jgi:hypothetical protein